MIGYIACAIALVVVALRLATRRNPNGPQFRYFIALLLVGGTAAVFISPVTIKAIASSGLEPFPHAGYLLGSLLSNAAAFCVLGMLSYGLSDNPGAARRRNIRHLAVLIACSATMAILVILAHPRPSDDILQTAGSDPRIMVYQALYCGFIGYSAGAFVVLVMGYLNAKHRPRTEKASLLLALGGGIAGVAWSMWTFARSVAGATGTGKTVAWAAVSELISALCLTSLALGAGISVRFWTSQLLRDLEPLWQRVSTVGAELMTPLPTTTLRLHNMVVKIRDCQYRLRRFVHPEMESWATQLADEAGLTPTDRTTLIEAAQLVAAIDAFEADTPYHAEAAITSHSSQLSFDRLFEAQSLIRIEHMIVHCALVERLRERAASTTH